MEQILHYFPDISEEKKTRFRALEALYRDWNSRINVISRRDEANFMERHVLHSLAVAKFISFVGGSKIMDIGTGGGFPGIPLAIMFPESRFVLVDSIGKKTRVASAVAEAVGLKNVEVINARAEDVSRRVDFIVSRAVTSMNDFLPFTKGKFLAENKNDIANGMFCLKGGDLSGELKAFEGKYEIMGLADIFSESFFETKKLVYLPAII